MSNMLFDAPRRKQAEEALKNARIAKTEKFIQLVAENENAQPMKSLVVTNNPLAFTHSTRFVACDRCDLASHCKYYEAGNPCTWKIKHYEALKKDWANMNSDEILKEFLIETKLHLDFMRFQTADRPNLRNVPAMYNVINKQLELIQKGERDSTGQVELEMTKEFDKMRNVASETVKQTLKLSQNDIVNRVVSHDNPPSNANSDLFAGNPIDAKTDSGQPDGEVKNDRGRTETGNAANAGIAENPTNRKPEPINP